MNRQERNALEMCRKTWTNPSISVVKLDNADIIATSPTIENYQEVDWNWES